MPFWLLSFVFPLSPLFLFLFSFFSKASGSLVPDVFGCLVTSFEAALKPKTTTDVCKSPCLIYWLCALGVWPPYVSQLSAVDEGFTKQHGCQKPSLWVWLCARPGGTWALQGRSLFLGVALYAICVFIGRSRAVVFGLIVAALLRGSSSGVSVPTGLDLKCLCVSLFHFAAVETI